MQYIDNMKAEFYANSAQRLKFLRLHINATLILSVGYLLVFALIGAWISFASVLLYFLLILYVKYLRSNECSFGLSLSVACLFTLVPVICVLLSGVAQSPYLAWVVTPLFAAAALVGSGVVPLLAVVVLGVFTGSSLFDNWLAEHNELAESSYELMALLSVLSASGFLAFFVRQYARLAQKAQDQLNVYIDLLEARAQVLKRAGLFYVSVATSNCRILDCDEEWAQIAFAPYPDCIGQDRRHYFRSPEMVEVFDKMMATIRFDQSYVATRKTVDLDGDERFIEVYALKFPAKGEMPEHLVIYNRVVTEEVIRSQALQEALQRLESTNRKNHQIYGVIAHELRTPVAAIEMMSQHTDEEWLQDRTMVSAIANDLLNSIDDMKMLVNPELKRDIRLTETSLNELNATIQTMVASTVSVTGMQYLQKSDLPQALGAARFTTDSYRVKAAVVNLIRNACLHSGGTLVECQSFIASEPPEGFPDTGAAWAVWRVLDNGVGIPEDKAAQLARPFNRLGSTSEGTGLGLYIAKTWIEEIGGLFTYQRQETGSLFEVQVPLSNEASAAPPDLDRFSEARRCAHQLRVLCVEDDKVLQLVSLKLLSKVFKSVKIAVDGEQGLAMAQRGYDLILTDFFMPNMSGAQMTRALREKGWRTPIVGVTAATIAGQKQELLDAGVDLVLFKPINADIVLRAVGQLQAAGHFADLTPHEGPGSPSEGDLTEGQD